MDQAALYPLPPSARLQRISQERLMPHALRDVGHQSCPDRNGELPLAVPDVAPDGAAPHGSGIGNAQAELLDGLRQQIHAIERHVASPASGLRPRESLSHLVLSDAKTHAEHDATRPWTLGASELDGRLGPAGLDATGVHEVKPVWPRAGEGAAGDWAAALGFMLRLAVCRARALSAAGKARIAILWCATDRSTTELGRLYGPGLASLGLDPSALIMVEATRSSDVLWAMEEGLKSESLALVIGVLDEVGLTSARRLNLAAEVNRTPCLLLTDARLGAAGASATRWRVGAHPSAPHSFDARAPGPARYAVMLERCRNRSPAVEALPFMLEWSDETHRFRMASALAGRAPLPASARGSA